MANQKWIPGTAVKKGDYIDLRLELDPVEVKTPYGTVLTVCNSQKGVGKYSSGLPYGMDNAGRILTIKVSGRLTEARQATDTKTTAVKLL